MLVCKVKIENEEYRKLSFFPKTNRPKIQFEEVSGAGELPSCALSEPDLNLSAHPAPIIQPWVLHQTANAEIIRAASWLFSLTNIPHL